MPLITASVAVAWAMMAALLVGLRLLGGEAMAAFREDKQRLASGAMPRSAKAARDCLSPIWIEVLPVLPAPI